MQKDNKDTNFDSEGRTVVVCDNGTGVSGTFFPIEYPVSSSPFPVHQMWLLYIEFS